MSLLFRPLFGPRHLLTLVSGLTFSTLATASSAAAPTAAPPAPQPAAAAPAAPHSPALFQSTAPLKTQSKVDQLVMAKLRPLGIQPALCSDSVFVRRAYLDVIGILPTATEARQFIEDTTADKRRLLIDRLLERKEFPLYWSMKWADLLRIKAEFPVNLWPNAAQAYHRWVLTAIEQNKPYDQFARELLTSSGSNFRVGPVNFYRAIQSRTPEAIASTVALTFMGVRAENWPKEKLAGMTAFFSQIGYKPTSEWKEEYVFWDPIGTHSIAGNIAPGRASIDDFGKPLEGEFAAAAATTTAAISSATFPDGTTIKLPANRDPRELFADWLISPLNPWFTKNITNRVWSWLMGQGIIEKPDDIRDNNPPSNPELLAHLQQELVKAKFDLKHLYRLILNSEAYQFASVASASKPQGERLFASYPMRRLEAEVLIDAINQITGTTELYTSPIPEPFTYIPQGKPAVAIGDGSITSPFLALFGRSARATGTEDERSNKFISSHWLHLLNSSHIQQKLDRSLALKAIVEARREPVETLNELYLTVLSRFPTPAEVESAQAYAKNATVDKKTGVRTVRMQATEWNDIAWALINTNEFVFRH